MAFHEKLFYLRKKSGKTQAELAEELGVSRQAISKWEMGAVIPDIHNTRKISKVFDVSIESLLDDNLELESQGIQNPVEVVRVQSIFGFNEKIIGVSMFIIVTILGVATKSIVSLSLAMLLIVVLLLIIYISRMIRFFLNKKSNDKNR